ncbi:type I polyketide synthase, partial [Actinosynnema sp. NPDC059335]|uniref:type I polyketide synthase n=1 Tax=Actinosynnema sp. NPDC059335 TaxID=3346804 RepID=UPI0036720A0A
MTAPEDTAATLRRAYTTMQRLRRDLEAHERARTEPIAVVGLGCRFPGGAVDGDSYWDLLASGTDAVREIPPDRWDVDAFFSAEPRPGKVSTRSGGFLDRVDAFDHDFFGISRREALAMDPQQRLTLEVVWEALEDSGRAPTRLAGSRTGVFMGVSSFDYATEHLLDPVDFSAHAGTGVAHSVVTGRVSYTLDLRGPSMAIDTACSSALVAVHQACQSLRLGESDLAVAGGVNVVLSPLPSVSFSQFGRMVSVDGRCKAFDASANGYVRSEGCGAVVLKRLSDAERDGDRVLAVIRGAAVNQDGRSAGVTAPNGSAQREVLRQALAAAGVGPDEVTFVEAHGTGTRLGDPIEVEALAEVYGRPAGPPLHLGSSKTNIGHAEAAAGIAGLIKVVLALHKGAIPGNVHFRRLNPNISFAGTTFTVPTALTPWPETGGPRTAGVSSFGFSGTNAHVILQQAPERAAPAEADDRRPRSVLALSAKSPTALTALAARYRDRFATAAEPVADLCYSANTGRSAFAHRLAVTGGTAGEVAERLAAFAEGVVADGVAVGRAGSAGEVVFLFTGQGVQRVDMARGLYETQPTFRAAVDECDAVLRPMLERPLLSVLYPDGGDRDLINRTAYAQPAVFAVEYALARLWQSWGVRPAAVLGHSFGEYVAACVAGAMSLEDGLALTVVRSRLMQTLSGTGAMASVAAPELVVAEELAAHPGRISVAAVNGPTATTISGDGELVDAVCAAFTARGIRAKRLHITTASHSPLVEPILDELRAAAERITFSPPVIPLVSNVTGELWPWDQAPDADYWCRHARQPVRFATGVATLRALGHRAFVEVGPTATLLGLVNDMLPAEDEAVLVPSLRPGRDDWQSLLAGVALLHTRGGDIDWAGFDADYTRTRVPVPTYAFDPTPSRRPPRRRGGPVPAAEERADGSEEFADEALPHRLVWRRSTAPAVADGVRRAWLVLADAGGVGDAVAAHAARRGERSVVVVAGERYRHDGDRATVRRDHPADRTPRRGGVAVGDGEFS